MTLVLLRRPWHSAPRAARRHLVNTGTGQAARKRVIWQFACAPSGDGHPTAMSLLTGAQDHRSRQPVRDCSKDDASGTRWGLQCPYLFSWCDLFDVLRFRCLMFCSDSLIHCNEPLFKKFWASKSKGSKGRKGSGEPNEMLLVVRSVKNIAAIWIGCRVHWHASWPIRAALQWPQNGESDCPFDGRQSSRKCSYSKRRLLMIVWFKHIVQLLHWVWSGPAGWPSRWDGFAEAFLMLPAIRPLWLQTCCHRQSWLDTSAMGAWDFLAWTMLGMRMTNY